MKKWLFLVVTVLAFVLVLAGCGVSSDKVSEDKSKLKVVTTFYPMYDFTKNVAGDNASIEMLIDAGTEPHDYEPSAKDIAKIEEADVFVYNSEDMETWVPSVLKSLDSKKLTVIDASKGIKLVEGTEEEHDHDHGEEEHHHEHDPHVWLSPVLAQQEVANIQKGLTKADKTNTDTYKKNAENYTDKLKALDNEFKTAFEGAKQRDFVTQHAAFQYLANEYDLHQVAIAGLSPDQEPSPARLAELQKYVKANNITTIYFEEVASPKVAETLAKETGANLEVLSPIEGITDKEQKKGMDYIAYMEQNLQALQKTIK
ncbi:metal ABC transporter substrate-binding protein [Listeria cossartiae subsp. cayugensis]|uniref:metal ABC transporter substrate-binding protein n=1 Tax=Listeria cossartiae TaxID=2838249 RepID=UPI0028803957|nr:metal ABC transporter substrate-binding protein [Listeria cossartiae]MDT0000674.1 metal ABC transporter substrate-binding protein [Listeria cossartiae subsp. cayugensis]MDT0009222.1 metal ABC transporter substrate-binding protein [Listeria cossartiae subsp. cayugensis]MDT0031053.1 metal ABC transporter substrate-binding protein [Listeria cossartiae subsp. cayugensis]MDT0039169.1 metal ABC transporter substrate-binding protein [Listeria cossartiae subsp. cayugensis]MDT0044171.1 metal ABC tra